MQFKIFFVLLFSLQTISMAEEVSKGFGVETKLEKPDPLPLRATRDSVDTWEVRVSWSLPRLLPDSYTVILLMHIHLNYTIVIPGNASEVVFKDVKGEGTYYLSIHARLGDTTTTSNIASQFSEMPKNVTVEAIKDSVDTWEVHVCWGLPRLRPDSYTVKLRPKIYRSHTIVIPGNPSEVVFKNVKGEGTYDVSIEARLDRSSSTMRALAQFPDENVIPQNVTVEAIKDSVDTWEVHVGWGLPRLLPDSYTVTLLIDKYDNHTIVIPGNVSEVEFKDVKGEGNYDVMIKARLGYTIATSSTRARFPVPEATNTTTIILSALGVMLVLIVIICIAICTKRNRAGTTLALPATAQRFEPFYPNMLFRRECDMEIAEIEQHVYEEVGSFVYDVIAPSICSYEEIDLSMGAGSRVQGRAPAPPWRERKSV